MTTTTPTALPHDLDGTVLIAGAGVSGAGCAHMLSRLGVNTVIADDNETARLRVAEATGATPITTAQAANNLAAYSAVVTSPGWRPDNPLLAAAAAAGLPVFGEIELAWRLDQAGLFGAPRTWLVVTGTNGKTTTTAMLAEMMNTGAARAAAVGNIGVAIADALVATPRVDILVAELSSFQLHWCTTLTPAAGVVLNLADDHLDWHGGFAAYGAAKAKALNAPIAVVGADCPAASALIDTIDTTNTRVVTFTLNPPKEGQLGVEDGNLVDRAFGNGVLCPADGISPPGPAGILDALAAAALALSQGIEPAGIAKALESFEVSRHRGQIVHTAGPLTFIDNSKATNPHATDSALDGHERVVWVAGGQLKGADITGVVRAHAHRLLGAVLLGVDRQIIADALHTDAPEVPVTLIDDTDPAAAMDATVAAALDLAARHGGGEDTAIILAPAAASLDMYTGMSQRGDFFARAARTQAPAGEKA